MTATRFCYENEGELQDLLLEAIQRLAAGEMVGVPTNQGYVGILRGSWLPKQPMPDLSQLVEQKQLMGGSVTWAWLVRDAHELHDLFDPVPAVAERLLDRCLPGSVILELPAQTFRLHRGGQWEPYLLEPLVQVAEVDSDGQVASCVSCQMISGTAGNLLQSLAPWPLLVASVQRHGDESQDCLTPNPSSLEKLFPNCLNCVIDEGELAVACSPAIVTVQHQGVSVIQSGPFTEASIMERGGPSLLFVCTGNTCRSPMAEALCRKMLADRLSCNIEELKQYGVEIMSAGIAADYGSSASPEAVDLLSEDEIELVHHQSQPLSAPLLDQADYIFTMTAQHRLVILNHRPELADRVRVLGPNEQDIPDPYGGSRDVYRQCRQVIESALVPIVDQIAEQLSS